MNRFLQSLAFSLVLFSMAACASHPYNHYDRSNGVSVYHHSGNHSSRIEFQFRNYSRNHYNYRYGYDNRRYHRGYREEVRQKRVYYGRAHPSHPTYSREAFIDRGWCVTQQITKISEYRVKIEEWRTTRFNVCR